jgi:phospholipase C
VIARVALVLGALLTVLASPGIASGVPAAVPRPQHAPRTPVRHLVVMTQDQHSFDNYFGTRPGADGIPPGTCVPAADPRKPCVAPFAINPDTPQARLRASAAAQARSVDRGRMDGFVRAQAGPESSGAAAMGYYRSADVPALGRLADRAVLFDRWFGAVPGGTIANRLFGMAAQAKGDPTAVPAAGWGTLPVIFDRLEAAGVSWKVYVQNYEPALTIETAAAKARSGGQIARVPLLAMPRYTNDQRLSSHIVDLKDYFSDLAANRLPAVSYVVSTSSVERAPAGTSSGENPITTVANALIASASWSSSAFVLNWDTAGGWFDHVTPPVVDGSRLGLRVPALLISPYAAPRTVDHTTYDSAAVLGFIERNWNVAPLTRRDQDAARLERAFDFRAGARPAVLVDVGGHGAAVSQPSSLTLYVGYGLALAAAAFAMAWALRGERRRIVVKVGRVAKGARR